MGKSNSDSIISRLIALKDDEYKKFHCRLIPNISSDTILGVKTPFIRELAKQLIKHEYEDYLNQLPHKYYEENNLHAFIIELIDDFSTCIAYLEAFLPYIDNWATCDSLSPKCFKKHKKQLLQYIIKWINSNHIYTIRFGVNMLMKHYLDDDFNESYLELVANIKHDDYYVKMVIAWYFATALSKQQTLTIPYIKEHKLDEWILNKTIQKARESRRISKELKQELLKW